NARVPSGRTTSRPSTFASINARKRASSVPPESVGLPSFAVGTAVMLSMVRLKKSASCGLPRSAPPDARRLRTVRFHAVGTDPTELARKDAREVAERLADMHSPVVDGELADFL